MNIHLGVKGVSRQVRCRDRGAFFWLRQLVARWGQALYQALEVIREDPLLDERKVVVAALSNGGIGAGILGQSKQDEIQGLILLSALMREEYFASSKFLEQWQKKPILIVRGGGDRIPIENVRHWAKRFREKGLNVQVDEFKEQAHFLFLLSGKRSLRPW